MATKKTEGVQKIVIKPVQVQKARISIVGDTPLLVHAWSEKAKKEMLDAQQKKKPEKKAKEPRDPFMEFCDALYWITEKPKELNDKSLSELERLEVFKQAVADGAKFGFPMISIKEAALSACYRAGILPNQMGMKCSFFLNAVNGVNKGTGSELAVIETNSSPLCREDMVRLSGPQRSADLRYRPVFNDWKIRLEISLIDVGTFDISSIVNAIHLGGLMCGIGEWRMERDGDFGRFHVEIDEEAV